MPLLSVFQSNRAAVHEFSIEQVVATAGDGSLRDGSLCSQEIRDYFAQIPSEKLGSYIEQCLSSKFDKGGMVLQDLVNELGKRLDYRVTNGRYQGVQNAVGFDGIWVSPEGGTIVAEVKTTDAYRLSLDTIAGYREKLLAAGEITGQTSILIVVGRQDTGELEAQVRGSRHAWDMRLISAEALIKLVKLKENSDDSETGRKIRSVLTPMEYTRLDRMVDVMFTTATDVTPPVEPEPQPELVDGSSTPVADVPRFEEQQLPYRSGTWVFTDPQLLESKRKAITEAMSGKLQGPLVKKSRALFWSADHARRVVCTISKRYTKRGAYPYWYAYHPQWNEFLQQGQEGYLVLGCMDLPVAFAVPRDVVQEFLPRLNTTAIENGMYWHIHLVQGGNGDYELLTPKGDLGNIGLTQFEVALSDEASL